MHKQAPAHKKPLNKGFTLIELLVVVVIISISIGFVVVNISTGGDEDLVDEEILRLQQVLRFAHEQSVVRAEEYGVRFYETGYRFMRFDEEKDIWVYIVKDKLLRSRTLPEPLELTLFIEQTPVDILESQKDEPEIEEEKENKLATAASNLDTNISKKTQIDEAKKIKPNIYLLSSSELTPPFEVSIRVPGDDIEESIQGLPQGEYEHMQADQ